jgi:hypothetical protein
MDPEYIRKVQQWVTLDNKIRKNKEDIKDIVSLKKECEDSILSYVEANNQQNLVVTISDGTIKFSSCNRSQPISLKFLKIILEKYSTEKTQINHDELYKYITENISKTTTTTIDRKFASD